MRLAVIVLLVLFVVAVSVVTLTAQPDYCAQLRTNDCWNGIPGATWPPSPGVSP